jgi:hypothetical protein
MTSNQLFRTFQIWKFGIWFKYSNLNQGLRTKNNENKLKQGFGNLKRNLNVFENQAFGL